MRALRTLRPERCQQLDYQDDDFLYLLNQTAAGVTLRDPNEFNDRFEGSQSVGACGRLIDHSAP